MRQQYEFYVVTKKWCANAYPRAEYRPKGWVCNPTGDDVVTAWRMREVSDWVTMPLRESERLPRQVMKDIGVLYEDGIYGDDRH